MLNNIHMNIKKLIANILNIDANFIYISTAHRAPMKGSAGWT